MTSRQSFTFIDLFSGIGGMRIPFDELGYRCVFSSEWDTAAAKTYEANFGESPHGDITRIAAEEIPPHDLLLAGFPCQPFSIIGKMEGFADTRGTLFFEIERILRHHRPQALLLENVKQLVSHDKGRTLRVILNSLASLGYHTKHNVLNALHFGLPQKRERLLIVGFLNEEWAANFSFSFPSLPYSLHDVLEEQVPAKYFASPRIQAKRLAATEEGKRFSPSVWHENKNGHLSILDYSCALRRGASYNYLLVDGKRRFTPRELLRLQGFPEAFRIVVSDSEIRKQTGNSVPVAMVRAVARRMDEVMRREGENG